MNLKKLSDRGEILRALLLLHSVTPSERYRAAEFLGDFLPSRDDGALRVVALEELERVSGEDEHNDYIQKRAQESIAAIRREKGEPNATSAQESKT